MMIKSMTIPNEEQKKCSLEKLKASNLRLELLGLDMDELLGIIENELRFQKRECLRKKNFNKPNN